METTLLTIEFLKGQNSYYFDQMNESKRIRIFWHDKFVKSFDTLDNALIWFIQNRLNDTVRINNYQL